MGMTPQEYFESFVRGNYDDYVDDPGSVRRAFNAAVSASHLADHYYEYHRKNDPSTVAQYGTIGPFVEYLSQQTGGDFKDIRSISNVYKHLYESADPKKAAHSSISSAGAIQSIDFADDEPFSRVEEEFEGDGKVVFTRKDGQKLDFLPVLTKVFEYWAQII